MMPRSEDIDLVLGMCRSDDAASESIYREACQERARAQDQIEKAEIAVREAEMELEQAHRDLASGRKKLAEAEAWMMVFKPREAK